MEKYLRRSAISASRLFYQTENYPAVLAGATAGTVQVVTPGGTLSSNVPFRVIQ